MTSRDFCYWLQGVMEIGNPESLNNTQIQTIKNHLNMVFLHEIDPSYGNQNHQTNLNNLHNTKEDFMEDVFNANVGTPRC